MWEDGENQAYARLIEYLWNTEALSAGYASLRDCAESVLGGFLEPERVQHILNEYFKEPELPYRWVTDISADKANGKRPSKSGWYLVICRKGEERFITTCHYWKGSGWYLSEKHNPEDDYDDYVIKWQNLPPLPEDQ
jgi:hypothetical protein